MRLLVRCEQVLTAVKTFLDREHCFEQQRYIEPNARNQTSALKNRNLPQFSLEFGCNTRNYSNAQTFSELELKSRRLLITEVFFSFSKHALPKTKRLQLNKKLRTSLIYVKLEAKAEDCKTLQTPLVSQRVLLTGRPQTC